MHLADTQERLAEVERFARTHEAQAADLLERADVHNVDRAMRQIFAARAHAHAALARAYLTEAAMLEERITRSLT